MPENPYLETEDLPISTEKPERVNPYLLARENPYLEATEVPILEQGVEPSLFQRGKEAVTDFFRRDPGLGPLTEEDFAAFEPADVLIPKELAIEPTITDVPALDIEGQLPPVEPVEPIDPTLAMAGLTPGEAALGRPISAITGKPIPTPEEEAAAGKAAMAIIPYGFASAVRGVVPPALERAVMDPLTKAIVGKEYISPIDEALKIGEYLPKEARAAIGVPAHMAGAIVPLGVSFKTANAMMKAAGLPADLVLRTGPVMDRIAGHVARGGLAGAVYGGLEAGTPKGMAEDAAFFGALEGGLGAVGGIFRKIFSANWYRNLEVKERGLVVQSLDDMLNRGYSEGEILRQWDNPAWRAEALARRMEVEPVTRPTAKDIAKEAIREELIKRPEAPVAVVPEEPIPAIPSAKIVPEVLPVTPEPVSELPPVPEELAIERKPILSTYGTPWKTEARASLALKSKKLKDMRITGETHEVVPVEDGFGVMRKVEEIVEKPIIAPEPEKPIIEAPLVKEEIPVEPIKPEAIIIPEFKNTEEALAFGKTATSEQIEVLKVKRDESLSKSDVLKAKGDLQGAMDEATRGQFFREAIESAEKEIVEPKVIEKPEPEVVPEIEEKIPKEPVVKVLVKEPWEMGKEEYYKSRKRPIPFPGERAVKIRELEFADWGEKIGQEYPTFGMTDKEVSQWIANIRKSAIVEYNEVLTNYKKTGKTGRETFMGVKTQTSKEVLANVQKKLNESEQTAKRIMERHKKDKKSFYIKDRGWMDPNIVKKHGRLIKQAIKSGKLTPEKYAELHEKDYGPLSEFMPEVVAKAPPEVPEIKEIPKIPKILEAPEKVVKPVPEKPEVEKPFEPDLATLPLKDITVKTKALRETTGEIVIAEENARDAIERIDEEIEKYYKLLECL